VSLNHGPQQPSAQRSTTPPPNLPALLPVSPDAALLRVALSHQIPLAAQATHNLGKLTISNFTTTNTKDVTVDIRCVRALFYLLKGLSLQDLMNTGGLDTKEIYEPPSQINFQLYLSQPCLGGFKKSYFGLVKSSISHFSSSAIDFCVKQMFFTIASTSKCSTVLLTKCCIWEWN
jgi:hypothetical protein